MFDSRATRRHFSISEVIMLDRRRRMLVLAILLLDGHGSSWNAQPRRFGPS
jgi:hypothetical protein